ncbi:MAG TPA: aminodeoxychorismate/anthranilate synthase component II [Longimicrobiales bacterium]|nr:aminodeoxychorismate/anthranilate synthase component II [Longimicrobiales bacterium]
MLLVIDNYDSFTWNLVQYLAMLGADPVVKRNDEVSVDAVLELAPARIVISPGPCSPAEAGISVELIRRTAGTIPILGVCLGHQAIAVAWGGRVRRAERPMHGKLSRIEHEGDILFDEITSPFTVTRYHSLVVEPQSLPAALAPIAWTATPAPRELQALRHREHPVWGVQFHPESIASENGMTILHNFLEHA